MNICGHLLATKRNCKYRWNEVVRLSVCLQVAVVCLVILDACFVLAELLIDLSVIKLDHGHIAPEVNFLLTVQVIENLH